jgi:hypothetical protein
MAIEGYEVLTQEWTNPEDSSVPMLITFTAPEDKVVLTAGIKSSHRVDMSEIVPTMFLSTPATDGSSWELYPAAGIQKSNKGGPKYMTFYAVCATVTTP